MTHESEQAPRTAARFSLVWSLRSELQPPEGNVNISTFVDAASLHLTRADRMASWYYHEFGEEVGPISPVEMKQRVADGTITTTTRVRREDGNWTTADRIPGLLKHQAAAPVATKSGDGTGGLIPYKNAPALIAYYLAIFSLIPCIGLPLGIGAVVLGVIGLKKRRENPAVSGTAHAWIGIVLGGITTLLWGGLMLMGAIGAATTA